MKARFFELWNDRNPQHETNCDTGKDMFYDTAFMVCQEYSNEQNKKQNETLINKDREINGFNIKIGDIVSINFNGSQLPLSHRAMVKDMPTDIVKDCWIFEDIDSGDIHYVNEPCTITKNKVK